MPHVCSKIYLRLFWRFFCFNVVIQIYACSDRPRLNPLDPLNPETRGKPSGLSVMSVRDTVTLQWDELDLRDLNGFRIYRQVEGQAGFSFLAQTPPEANSYHHPGATFGLAHAYRISAVAADFESLLSDGVTITPGPTFSWLADERTGDLIQLTHDGLHEILRVRTFGIPIRLQIDAARGYVWVLNRFGGEFLRLDRNKQLTAGNQRLDGPADLAVDQVDGCVWVADSLSNGLMKFDSAGALIKTFEAYKKIAALAVHPLTADLWALDRASQRVLILSRAGDLRRVAPVDLRRPADIAIDARTNKVWIADGDRVLKLNAQGDPEQIAAPALRFAYRIAADEASGGCWVIDYSLGLQSSDVIKLKPTGEALFTSKGFDIPENLAVNPFDGACLIADRGNRRLVRLAADGRQLGTYERVSSPVAVDTAQ
jgi:hypothetical protein